MFLACFTPLGTRRGQYQTCAAHALAPLRTLISGSLSLTCSHTLHSSVVWLHLGGPVYEMCISRRGYPVLHGFAVGVRLPLQPHLELEGRIPLAEATGTEKFSRIEHPTLGQSSFVPQCVRCLQLHPTPLLLPFEISCKLNCNLPTPTQRIPAPR